MQTEDSKGSSDQWMWIKIRRQKGACCCCEIQNFWIPFHLTDVASWDNTARPETHWSLEDDNQLGNGGSLAWYSKIAMGRFGQINGTTHERTFFSRNRDPLIAFLRFDRVFAVRHPRTGNSRTICRETEVQWIQEHSAGNIFAKLWTARVSIILLLHNLWPRSHYRAKEAS